MKNEQFFLDSSRGQITEQTAAPETGETHRQIQRFKPTCTENHQQEHLWELAPG